MLKRFLIGSFLSVALSAQAEPAPSFDCAKAASNVEKLICQSPELAELDREMATLYAFGAPAIPLWSSRIEPNWMARIQALWLKQRDKCGDIDCLGASYQGHIENLDSLKFLDWDVETDYMAVLDIAKDQRAVMRDQQGWRKLLDRCIDMRCLEQAFAQRRTILSDLLKSVPRAGMKKYVNKKLGIGFDFLENRTVEPCDDADCVKLLAVATARDTPVILEIHVQEGSLSAAAHSIWKRRGAKWMAAGRFSEAEVEPYSNGWQGLQATNECSYSDRSGMHAAGECNTYLRSNGKRAIIIRDTAVSGKDAASLATIASVRFLP
jgi:uncharacterized protein